MIDSIKERVHLNSSNDFTIVLPIRGTDRELGFMKKSIPSAIKLNPGELILACDEPMRHEVNDLIISLMRKNDFTRYRIVSFPRDSSWGFQLANVIWNCYKIAKYDKIYSFDIDSVVRKEALKGYDIVGKNGVAIVSLTKKLRTKTPMEIRRYIFYRIRVHQSDYVFSGNYWIYRPYFFDMIKLDEYKTLKNGVDTFLTNKIKEQNKYKIITLKEKGINSLDIQNEDYEWRQFQTGVWIGANNHVPIYMQPDKKLNWKNVRMVTIGGLLGILFTKILRDPDAFIKIKAFMYGHPKLVDGYKWAKDNPKHEVVQSAKSMTYDEWGYQGGSLIKKLGMKWGRSDGTGF